MSIFDFEYAPGKRLTIGFRTPGLGRRGFTQRQKVELAVELGMSVVEPQLNAADFPDVSLDAARELRKAADELGVRIPTMGCELTLTEPVGEIPLEQQLDRLIEFAGVLGVAYAFCQARVPSEGVTQAQAWQALASNGRAAAERLAAENIQLALEADLGNFTESTERVAKALRLVDHPNLYFNFDPTNVYKAGSDPVRTVHDLASRIRSGHIKDARYRGPNERGDTAIGAGEVPYADIFRAMMEEGISATMHLEHVDDADGMRAAANHVAGVLESLRE